MHNRGCENVLLLDAHLRHSLAIARNLGKHAVRVVTLSAQHVYPAKVSRYTWKAERFDYSDIDDDPVERLIGIAEKYDARIVIPAALGGYEFLCRNRDRLEGAIRAPFNELATFMSLSHKDRTVALARELGVPVPESITIADAADLDTVDAKLQYPVVFKSTVDQGTVRYAGSRRELAEIYETFRKQYPELISTGRYPIVQEYIEGSGHGFYGLAKGGEILAYFMHRRIHEVPPSGGPSAMAGAYYDDELKELGSRFFSATLWNGVAMVEFKRSKRDGRYYLIEVNPKFWGSLDLSITAGVEFPWLLYGMLTGKEVSYTPGRYNRETVFRWLTMDLAYAVKAKKLVEYIKHFFKKDVTDDFRWDDLLPFLVLFIKGIGRYF